MASPPTPSPPIRLSALTDALDAAVFVANRMPFVVDPTSQARRFLQYQSGQQLFAMRPADVEPERLRRALVSCLRYGGTLSLVFGAAHQELEPLFSPTHFPEAVLDPSLVLDEAFWGPLLRPGKPNKDGEPDPAADDFQPLASFRFVVLSPGAALGPEGGVEEAAAAAAASGGEAPPPAMAMAMAMACQARMATIVVEDSVGAKRREKLQANGAEVDVAALAVSDFLGVKDVVRNSKDLVAAAFEGQGDVVKEWMAKGYSADSVDGRGNSALSEAACKGHAELVDVLLDEGCNPNSRNDQGRTPLYRAAFQGHQAACEALLEAGADCDIRAGDEKPQNVANTPELKALLTEWDRAKTLQLLAMRRKELEAKMEAKLTTAAQREAFARVQIANELVKLAEDGDAAGLTELLEKMINEAMINNERARGKAETRDGRGNTLLMIAAAKGHLELARTLIETQRAFDPNFDKLEHSVWYCNVNARDPRGWNATSIATFHQHKAVLQFLLDAGGDPLTRNSYNKSAVDFAKDTLDACRNVVEDRSEVRRVIISWDDARRHRREKNRGKGGGVEREKRADLVEREAL